MTTTDRTSGIRTVDQASSSYDEVPARSSTAVSSTRFSRSSTHATRSLAQAAGPATTSTSHRDRVPAGDARTRSPIRQARASQLS